VAEPKVVPRRERPFWVAEQLTSVLVEGLSHRRRFRRFARRDSARRDRRLSLPERLNRGLSLLWVRTSIAMMIVGSVGALFTSDSPIKMLISVIGAVLSLILIRRLRRLKVVR